MKDLFGNDIVEPKLIDREVLVSVLMEHMRGIDENELVSMLYSK